MQITIHMYESEHSQAVGNLNEIPESGQQLYMQTFLQTTAALGQMQQVGEFSTIQAGGALFYDGTFLVDAQAWRKTSAFLTPLRITATFLLPFI